MSTNYERAIIFTKHTNLSQWFDHQPLERFDLTLADIGTDKYLRLKQHYATPRNVQLILLIRYEHGHTYCKIKCPINPMPVKGEFETVSPTQVVSFLKHQGWVKHDVMSMNLFK